MSYTALYRKFRPARFADVKGQEPIVTTLQNQIRAQRIGHAYLFCGTRGTGKTTIAKIFARAVNCEDPKDGEPCGECAACRAIASGASMNVIEIDAASNNGVENIRNIIEEVAYSPASGKYKVYIIDEVHMLSIGAFNALLKTLEEPPSYVIFILATTEAHKIPVTILSRCQRYDFRRIPVDTIADRLRELTAAEQVSVEERALRYLARMADGSMRDALSLLDQCIAFHLGQELTYDKVLDVLGTVDTEVFSRLLRAVADRDVTGCITLLEELVMQGRELSQFVTDFTWYLRNLMLAQNAGSLEEIIDVSSENLARLKEEAALVDPHAVMRYIRIFSELSGRLRYAAQKRILIEVALIKLCQPSMETTDDSLLERIRALEEKVERGVPVQAGAGAPAAEERRETPPLPKALPEDVREIVANWPGIARSMGMPIRSYLKDARLSLSEDGRLLVVLENVLAFDYMKKPENQKQLEDHIAEVTGKEAELLIRGVESQQEFENRYVDLSRFVHMEIEEEE